MSSSRAITKQTAYRFAFIGTSGSGKTCILTQLARGRDSDTSCESSLLKDSLKLAAKEKGLENTDESVRIRKNYQNGLETINKAIASVEKGELPLATNLKEGRLFLDFVLGDDDRGNFRIKTEDYPGEAINPAALNDPNSLATKLRKRLSHYDGLIFVVDTFLPGEDTRKAEQMVQDLVGFFGVIKKEKGFRMNVPVAVIYSKWDKYSEINFNDRDAELQKFEEFLKSPQLAFYQKIVSSIRHATQDQENAANLGAYKQFPVSAFGKVHKDADGKIHPDPSQDAFGITAPFCWLANRCDELKMAELRQTKAPSFCRSFFSRRAAKELQREAAFQKARMPMRMKAWHKELKALEQKLQKQARQVFFARTASLLAGLTLSFVGFQQYTFKEWDRILKSPSASITQLDKMEANVARWIKVTSAIKIGEKKVRGYLPQIDEKKEAILWKPIADAEGIEQYRLAKDYLAQISDGKYAQDARKIVTKVGRDLEENAWKPVQEAETLEEKVAKAEIYEKYVQKEGLPGIHLQEVAVLKEELKKKQDEEAWKLVQEAETLEDKVAKAEIYAQYVQEKGLPGNHLQEVAVLKADLKKKQEEEAWKPVEEAETLEEKVAKAEIYSKIVQEKDLPGNHLQEVTALKEELKKKQDEEAWKLVQEAETLEDKVAKAEIYAQYVQEKGLPGNHLQEVAVLKADLKKKQEEEAWKPVEEAETLEEKVAKAEIYSKIVQEKDLPGNHLQEVTALKEELKKKQDEEAWKLVQEAETLEDKVAKAEIYEQYVQEKGLPGNHLQEVTVLKADLKKKQEEEAWKPVEEAETLEEKVAKAETYSKIVQEKGLPGNHLPEIAVLKEELKKKQDEDAWKPVEEAETLEDKVAKAEIYAQYVQEKGLPGKYLPEIAVLKNDLEKEKKDKAEKEKIRQDDEAWKIVQEAVAGTSAQREKAEEYIEKSDAGEVLGRYKNEALLIIESIKEAEEFRDAKGNYDRAGNFEDAESLFSKFLVFKKSLWEKIDFIEKIDKLLKEKNDGADEKGKISNCEKAIDALRNVEDKFREKNEQELAQKCLGKINECNTQKQIFTDDLDRRLYSEVRWTDYTDTCDAYLKGMTEDLNNGGKMREDVERLKQHLEKMRDPNTDFHGNGKGTFDDGIWAWDGTLEIKVNGQTLKTLKVRHNNKEEFEIPSFSFKHEPRKDIKVEAEITCHGSWGGSGKGKKYSNSVEVSPDTTSKTLRIDEAHLNIELKFSGWPERPDMPEWEDK